jgi:hypothetical protein
VRQFERIFLQTQPIVTVSSNNPIDTLYTNARYFAEPLITFYLFRS